MSYSLDELQFESSLRGQVGALDNNREIPVIDVSNFAERRAQITEALWQAATQVGFFQLSNHGISLDLVNSAFEQSQVFFAQERSQKQQLALRDGENAGWEYRQQIRPSTGNADEKESYQITLPNMAGLWPLESSLPNFKAVLLELEHQSWKLGMEILSCFAHKLGMPEDYFTQAHHRSAQTYQSTLRLLHYLPLSDSSKSLQGRWRAGAHTDFDCLTMVFQKNGEAGLQACPGKDAANEQTWTDITPRLDRITCNIGDMLMRWSDDKLKSTLHRVRMPDADQANTARYSMAFFCQANKEVVIQGPRKKYAPISASDYISQRIAANFENSTKL